MTNLSNKVLDELRDKDVKPVPAWRFLLQSFVAWCGFVVFVFFGAQAVSIILFLLSDHDWTELAQFRGGRLGYFFIAVPYLWLLALIVLIVVAYLDFKKTKGGYRYRPLIVVSVVIGVSLFAGIGLHAMGMGKRADALLEGKLPMYRQMAPRGMHIWNQPRHGRMIGVVEGVDSDGNVLLRTPDDQVKKIDVEPAAAEKIERYIESNASIRVMGEPKPDGGFKAKAIMPWKKGQQHDLRLRLHMRNKVREEILQRARSTGERSMRPPVHPVAPTVNQPTNILQNDN